MLAGGPPGLRRLLLGAALLLACWLDGTSGVPVQNPPQHQVDGVVGGTASLRALIPPEEALAKIEWDFRPEGSLALVIAEFIKGNLERPNPGDRFQQRLGKVGNTTLRIQGLVKKDGGVYTAHVRFKSAEVQEQTFLLVVSDESEDIGWWNFLILSSAIIMLLLIVLLKNPVKLLFRKTKPYFIFARWSLRLRILSEQERDTPSSPSKD